MCVNRSTFEIIAVDETQTKNKTPVIHVDNHLGLESWCVHHVYRHAHQIILAAAKKYPQFSSHCDGNSSEVHPQQHSYQRPTTPPHPFDHTLVKYLNCALLINPDVTTFWNARRRLLQKDRLDIGQEFKFSAIVLSKKPKSNDAFCYRRWLYSFQSHESIDWIRELSLCERCASKSLCNYQAWAHRQWVLQKAPFLLQYELATTERFIRKHIGDYSGYYHRQFVLYKMNEVLFFEHEHEPHVESNFVQYSSLINYLASIGSTAAQNIQHKCNPDTATTAHSQNGHCDDASATVAWMVLMKIIVPQRDFDINAIGTVSIDNSDKIRIKTFLYCMNVAAYDLKFVDELNEIFGYREAFECHRRAIVQFMADKCKEWSVAPNITNVVTSTLQNTLQRSQNIALVR